MNDLISSIAYMFIGSFIVQYFFMSAIMSNEYTNITNSIGKCYISVIMGLFMVLIEIAMFYMHSSTMKMNSIIYLPVVLLLLLFIYLYRTQTFIYDGEYLREMIEHHSMAILTSKEIIKKSGNDNVRKLANNIIIAQEKEIKDMKNLELELEQQQ